MGPIRPKSDALGSIIDSESNYVDFYTRMAGSESKLDHRASDLGRMESIFGFRGYLLANHYATVVFGTGISRDWSAQ